MKAKFSINRDAVSTVIERTFKAPRRLVWDVMFDPKHVSEWWGPKRYATRVDHMDVRVGGRWRFVNIEPSGVEHSFSGEYLEIDAPNRMVATFNYDPMGAGHELVETTVFESIDAETTRVVTTSRFKTLADLDSFATSGMESGAVETYERFAELVTRLRGQRPRHQHHA